VSVTVDQAHVRRLQPRAIITGDDDLAAMLAQPLRWPDRLRSVDDLTFDSPETRPRSVYDLVVVDLRPHGTDVAARDHARNQLAADRRFVHGAVMWVVGDPGAPHAQVELLGPGPILPARGPRPLTQDTVHELLADLTAIPLVLAVDDEPDVLTLIGVNLNYTGWRVMTAADGLEGFTRAYELEPDLIITGIMMPTMDGWEELRALKATARTADIPVVICSAKVQDPDIERGYEHGCVDYVTKPFSPLALDEVVTRHSSRVPPDFARDPDA
jgi:CheY-like chemotaxis protein